MEMSDVTRAIAAATSVAGSVGLPANDAIVVHHSNKLALRLTPCDVFARVAVVGQEVAQFEVGLAQRLAELGCPVVPLEPRVDPLVYTRDGFAVTLWTSYEACGGRSTIAVPWSSCSTASRSFRTGDDSGKSSCACCATVLRGRRSTW